VAGYQTAVAWQDTKLQWQDTKLQWQDTKLQGQDTKLQWQDTKLQWQDTKLQWQDTKLQWQDTKLQWQDNKLHAFSAMSCSGRSPNCAREFRHAYEKCALRNQLQWQVTELHILHPCHAALPDSLAYILQS
jgi:hypothetical protein